MKNKHLQQIIDLGVVAVIRAKSKKEATELIEAIIKGGIKAIEITYTIPDATEIIKDFIDLNRSTDILIGAGTVLNLDTAKQAIKAGAKFIVGPNLDVKIAKFCNKKNILYIPGCMTVNEIVHALRLNAKIIKLFPGSIFEPKIIKDIKGPLPNVKIMPTGGVSLENADQWIKMGAVAIGVGSDLTKYAITGEFDKVTEKSEQYIKIVKEARGENDAKTF